MDKPNVFISFPITNEEIINNIVKLQEDMIKHSPILKGYMQNKETIHITLDVHLINDKDRERSKQALRELGKEIENDILQNGPLFLTIEDLKTFFQPETPKIVYTGIQPGDNLNRLHSWKQFQRNIFHQSHGFHSKSRHNWNPHITIAKMLYRRDEHIPIKSFEEQKYDHFGVQEIESIELLTIDEDVNGKHVLLEKYDFKGITK